MTVTCILTTPCQDQELNFLCLCILSCLPEMFFPLATVALAPPFACKLHLHMFFVVFFSIVLIIWKSAFAVFSHWNNTHTCNIRHNSTKRLKMIQDSPSIIYKKVASPLEQLKLAYHTR